MPKILIVEDQVLTANHIKNILNDNNWHQIEIAYKINQAIELLETFIPDIILLLFPSFHTDKPHTLIHKLDFIILILLRFLFYQLQSFEKI